VKTVAGSATLATESAATAYWAVLGGKSDYSCTLWAAMDEGLTTLYLYFLSL
jgi:hypothetical protein